MTAPGQCGHHSLAIGVAYWQASTAGIFSLAAIRCIPVSWSNHPKGREPDLRATEPIGEPHSVRAPKAVLQGQLPRALPTSSAQASPFQPTPG